MAATKQLSIDVLLVTVERAIPYLELHTTYRTDGSDEIVKDYLDKAMASLEAGRQDDIEGVQYQVTKRGDVAIIWIELEDGTQPEIKECFAWLEEVCLGWAIAQVAGWVKQRSSSKQGYLGFSIQKKA